MKKFALLFAIIPVVLASSVFAAWNFASESNLDSNDSEELSIDYEFDKFYNVSYSGFNNVDALPAHAFEGREFSTNGLNYSVIKSITMNDRTLTKNSDYTINGGTLNIPSVDGDIAINAIKPPTDGLIAGTAFYNRTSTKLGDFNIYTTSGGSNGAIYNGNNGVFDYSSAGGIKCNDTTPIAALSASKVTPITNTFSASITFKGDPTQRSEDGDFPRTIIGIKAASEVEGYIFWMGFYKGYIHIYAYRKDTSYQDYNKAGTLPGFKSIDFKQYSKTDGNKIVPIVVNLIITANKNGAVNLWITDGRKITDGVLGSDTYSFTGENLSFDWNKCAIVLGDLAVGRNLKLIGTIYDLFLYNKILTREEVIANREYAAAVWPLGT